MSVSIVDAPDTLWEKIAKQTVSEFLKTKKINPQASVNVFFVSKKKMHALNLKYRKVDSPTDVLSFPIWEKKSDVPAAGEVSLGDIFVCPEETELAKLAFLIRHSLNHLIGKHHRV